MKIYLVVDEWQYDGGLFIYGAYLDIGDAVLSQQTERKRFSDANREHQEKWPSSRGPLWSEHRFNAIKVMEQEVK